LPEKDNPPLPARRENIEDWHTYLRSKFSLRDEDAAFVLPICDSGKHDAGADYDLFSPEAKEIWSYQLDLAVAKQRTVVKPSDLAAPSPPERIVYNISGTNARVNINSIDSSINTVQQAPPELFGEILRVVRNAGFEREGLEKMVAVVESMQRSYGTGGFGDTYRQFMATLADHIQVFGPILAPFLPALANLVTSFPTAL